MTTITLPRATVEQALSLCESVHGLRTDDEDGSTVWCQELIDALRAALAEPVQEPRTIRMERVDRSSSQHWWSEAARIRMPSPELYAAGDAVLCWVNEGDMLRALPAPAAIAKVEGRS